MGYSFKILKLMNKIYLAGFFALFIVLFGAISGGGIFACIYHAYQQCNGNYLYWYDSCGNQQETIQYCQNGCYNNSCSYNNYNNNCTYHAYKLCIGNNVYWYSGCNQQQDLYVACGASQICNDPLNYGQCSYAQPVPNSNPYPPYVVYNSVACHNNSLYWYDSMGVSTGLYKNCTDSNSCTVDACSNNKCVNTLKCDGSTCATNSADYNVYCMPAPSGQIDQATNQNNCGNGLCEPNLGETSGNCPNDCKINTNPAPNQTAAPAAVSSTSALSGFTELLKRWYLWIIGGLVLVILFIVIFRRLSSDV